MENKLIKLKEVTFWFVMVCALVAGFGMGTVLHVLAFEIHPGEVHEQITRCEANLPRSENCNARIYIVHKSGNITSLNPVIPVSD